MWRANLANHYDDVVAFCGSENIVVSASEKVIFSTGDFDQLPDGIEKRVIDIDISVVNCDAIDAALNLYNCEANNQVFFFFFFFG